MAGQLIQAAFFQARFFWEVPVVPGAEEARRWAQEELVQKAYQDAKPGFAEQIAALLRRALDDLFNSVGAPDGNIALAIATAVVLLAIAAIIFVIRPRLNRKTAATHEVFEGAQLLSAKQHRAKAESAAAAGDFHTAVSEAFRAMVRAAEERDVSLPAAGRTAVEVTAELERAFPAHAQALHRSAEVFNAVRYGQVPPTAEMYGEVTTTEQAIAATKPVYVDSFPPDSFTADSFTLNQPHDRMRS